MTLPQLSDKQLIGLYLATTNGMITARSSAVLTELRRRGYFFDILQSDFLTSEQWELRYGEDPPTDYAAYWRRIGEQLRNNP